MIKISAVSYINTIPFIRGLECSRLFSSIDLSLDYPSECADKLLNGKVDLGLVPIAIIPELNDPYIISDYCIGSDGPVDTVCVFSDVPIEDVESIALDYQSRTSVLLLRILLKEYWCLNPKLEKTEEGFEDKIKDSRAALIIGDRTFKLHKKYNFIYDLSDIWKKFTGLPFVFACWVSNKKLESSFVTDFNKALAFGLDDIDKIVYLLKEKYSQNIHKYLKEKISYSLDAEKRKSMSLFFNKISS